MVSIVLASKKDIINVFGDLVDKLDNAAMIELHG
jgi:hypothetical protein